MLPPLGAYSPTASRATVLLPHPLSPTNDSVVPSGIANVTSSTAFSVCRPSPDSVRCSQGRDTSK